jgi:epoxyqueuosine reductase
VSPQALRAELTERARAEGFDALGVAAVAPLVRDRARLADWLAQGRQAGMAWMARDAARRGDPRELLPGCRSIVVVAATYWPGRARARVSDARSRVALYARGRDYHRVLGQRLRRLAAWIEARSGARARGFVDTGPVLERAWAERAGIGWIGKNANLISRRLGSWLLLGELLTTAEIEADPEPHAEFCGSCTACIDACPTAAIVEPGTVDANRCISYWTIEHRGAVPETVRGGLGDWIFGCDVCQEVCPWNESFAAEPIGDPFGWREELRGLDPLEILAMDEATFRRRFSGTALMRARWDGLRRNACIVLGNRGRREALPALERALDDPDPVIRSHAAWAIDAIRCTLPSDRRECTSHGA